MMPRTGHCAIPDSVKLTAHGEDGCDFDFLRKA
jgi:hypothetical protein